MAPLTVKTLSKSRWFQNWCVNHFKVTSIAGQLQNEVIFSLCSTASLMTDRNIRGRILHSTLLGKVECNPNGNETTENP